MHRSVEDVLFDMFKNEQDKVSMGKFLAVSIIFSLFKKKNYQRNKKRLLLKLAKRKQDGFKATPLTTL